MRFAYRRLVTLDECAHVPVAPLRPVQSANGDRLGPTRARKLRSWQNVVMNKLYL